MRFLLVALYGLFWFNSLLIARYTSVSLDCLCEEQDLKYFALKNVDSLHFFFCYVCYKSRGFKKILCGKHAVPLGQYGKCMPRAILLITILILSSECS